MTTTTATEQAEKVDLTESNGAAPKRRGRPPGSKNKAKTATTTTSAPRRRRVTPAAPKTTGDMKAHAVLIESSSINVLLADGSSFKIDGPVFDRR